MEITKIGHFTAEEIEALQKAGSILGSAAKALKAGEINMLDEDAHQLLAALREVLGRVE